MRRKNNSKEKVLKRINKDVSSARRNRKKDYKRIFEDLNNISFNVELCYTVIEYTNLGEK